MAFCRVSIFLYVHSYCVLIVLGQNKIYRKTWRFRCLESRLSANFNTIHFNVLYHSFRFQPFLYQNGIETQSNNEWLSKGFEETVKPATEVLESTLRIKNRHRWTAKLRLWYRNLYWTDNSVPDQHYFSIRQHFPIRKSRYVMIQVILLKKIPLGCRCQNWRASSAFLVFWNIVSYDSRIQDACQNFDSVYL